MNKYDSSTQQYQPEGAVPSLTGDAPPVEMEQPNEVQGVSTLTARVNNTKRYLKFVGGVGFFILLLSFLFWWLVIGNREAEMEALNERSMITTSSRELRNLSYSQVVPDEPQPSAELTKPDLPEEVKPAPVVTPPPEPKIVYVPAPVEPKEVEKKEEGPSLLDLKRAAPMMGRTNVSKVAEKVQQTVGLGEEEASGMLGDGPVNKFRALMNGSKLEKTKVARMKNRHLTLEKGTFIDCILETRMDTSVLGMTACVIPQNVYSMDGKTLLIEKGSRALGEYTGAVANGLERIFVLWTEIRTPTGMIVTLDSPSTDQLGGAGMGGYVDFHWWKRFGNALLFSMISDGFDFATAKANEGSNNSYYNNTSNNMDSIIQEAMKQAGNIPPTLYKNQGERIGIFVGRDIDFSTVYELRNR